jgi:putative chitinase
MIQLSSDLLRQVAPRVGGQKVENQAAIIRELSAVLAETLAKFQIDNELRVAHFLAQTCHESDGFCTTVEYAGAGP